MSDYPYFRMSKDLPRFSDLDSMFAFLTNKGIGCAITLKGGLYTLWREGSEAIESKGRTPNSIPLDGTIIKKHDPNGVFV